VSLGFLGVQLHCDEATCHIHMTQEGLIKHIIKALGLDMDQNNANGTPTESKPLIKKENGEPQQDTFNYASVLGMLLYLLQHIRPDLAFSVSQVARFMFNPKHSHEIVISRLAMVLAGSLSQLKWRDLLIACRWSKRMTEAHHSILQPLKLYDGYKIQVRVYGSPQIRMNPILLLRRP
jgi:hypothetical protein